MDSILPMNTTYDIHMNIAPQSDQRYSPIHLLPNEILLEIFRIVYHHHRQPQHANQASTTDWKTEDLLAPSLFPFALASVCKRWRDVLALVPAFWTRLVFIIDTARPEYVETYLHLSGELPIDVLVTRSRLRTVHGDAEERERVAVLMNLIAPHIHRCTSIRFHVICSSSLPELRKNFRGEAPLLETFHLQCRYDDGQHHYQTTFDNWDFSCPSLRDLLLDGHNFCVSMQDELSWYRRTPSLEKVGVSRYRRPEKSTGCLSLEDVLELIAIKDYNFSIQDVSFDSMTVQRENPILASHISLKLLDAVTLSTILRFLRIEDLHIVLGSCELYLDSNTRVVSRLTIQNQERYNRVGLELLMNRWEGAHLTVDECASFDDALMLYLQDRWDSGRLLCRSWNALDVFFCPNLTIRALKSMVSARIAAASKFLQSQPTEGHFTRFEWLAIDGDYSISFEDFEWFNNHIPVFFFNGKSFDDWIDDWIQDNSSAVSMSVMDATE